MTDAHVVTLKELPKTYKEYQTKVREAAVKQGSKPGASVPATPPLLVALNGYVHPLPEYSAPTATNTGAEVMAVHKQITTTEYFATMFLRFPVQTFSVVKKRVESFPFFLCNSRDTLVTMTSEVPRLLVPRIAESNVDIASAKRIRHTFKDSSFTYPQVLQALAKG